MFKKTLLLSLFFSVALLMADNYVYGAKENTNTPKTKKTTTSTKRATKTKMRVSPQPKTISMGLGYHTISSGGGSVNIGPATITSGDSELHAFAFRAFTSDNIVLGGDFGFNANFNSLYIGPKINYILKKFPNLDVYVSGALYLRNDPKIGVNIPLVGGIEIALPGIEQVRFHTEHGIVVNLGGVNNISSTQGVFGNYGIIFYF